MAAAFAIDVQLKDQKWRETCDLDRYDNLSVIVEKRRMSSSYLTR